MAIGPDKKSLWCLDQANNLIYIIFPKITTPTSIVSTAITNSTGYSPLNAMCADKLGNMYVALSTSTQTIAVLRINQNTGVKTTITSATNGPSNVGYITGMCLGSDGNIWIYGWENAIYKLNTSTGTISLILSIKGLASGNFQICNSTIINGPDNYLYFAFQNASTGECLLCKLNPSNNSISYSSATPGSPNFSTVKLSVGPDGNIWMFAGNTNAQTLYIFDINLNYLSAVGIGNTSNSKIIQSLVNNPILGP